MPRVTAVCVLHALLAEPTNPDGTTAIDKRAIDGRVPVGPLGLAGDRQMDRRHHGGAEFAVYLYADEDARWWSTELGRPVPPGLFGENVRTSGLDVSALVVGQRLAVGGDGLVLEVTAPRTPCATFARRMGEEHWARRFTQRRAPGAYARVEVAGTIGAGDEVLPLSVPTHGITVADLMSPARAGAAAALLDAELAGELTLGERMRRGAVRERARG